ncbi:hypothetical protein [Algoriphagus boritolerans]
MGCSLTKNLKEGQYALYENEIKGIDQADKEELYGLIEQEPNTRFLGSSLGVTIYRFGEKFYDSLSLVSKLGLVDAELSEIRLALDTIPNDRKLRKRADKLISKGEGLKKKLEFGNALMRTGNPLVLLDSIQTETTVDNLQGYLVNHGFF